MNNEIPKKGKSQIKSALLETQNDTYDPVFVTKILEGEKARKEGKKGLRIDVENLWK